MGHKIVGRDLEINEEMVHVEFPHGQMETFVWLANHDDLGYHYEFMNEFFMSTNEYAVKVKFDLYREMIVPLINNYVGREGKFDKEDEHIFVAVKNKLEKCLDAINELEFVNREKAK